MNKEIGRRLLRAYICVTSAGLASVCSTCSQSSKISQVSDFSFKKVAHYPSVLNFGRSSSVRDYTIDSSKYKLNQKVEQDRDSKMASTDLVRVDFEVYGRVQGVFFRKYTQDEGETLGLRGFCRNTSAGTVSGTIEGPRSKVELMKRWLQTTGSPMSRIDRAVFKNEKSIDSYTLKASFGIERTL